MRICAHSVKFGFNVSPAVFMLTFLESKAFGTASYFMSNWNANKEIHTELNPIIIWM